jgi:fucose 4-O-acetylase-like acetyltransferase
LSQRELYIDRLRAALTAFVILHHTAITYGAPGGWFYIELKPSPTPVGMLLTMFVATQQAYFMGFFFLLAGYFTPASLESKGYARFLGDRFRRLGLPLLAFGFFLGPLTVAMVHAAQGEGFWPVLPELWRRKEFINGPLWFTQALLMFSIAYCTGRAVFGSPLATAERTPRPVPAWRWWMAGALLVGASALAIRQVFPIGENVIGLQLGFFASYIFLFVVGLAAWRHDWLRQLSWKNARPWIGTLVIAWPALPLGVAIVHALDRSGAGAANFSGGLSWPAVLYAFWEPFVAWGLIAALLLFFRARINRPSALWEWLGRRAYAVYIIHPPILVGIAILLHGWAAPALVKLAVTGACAIAACWLIADPLVRLPGLRRVV